MVLQRMKENEKNLVLRIVENINRERGIGKTGDGDR